ncbi:sigma-70 family RNA polymerase sigma factor [Reyranella sp.]|uniref:sigma-70 family RNA polymerase sigma factor n=1 Tax=Reyranella sp. TaxID=1929291 RepID=UPI0025D4A4ED|nr:sigma-70 family RNA polymerase sigma factor [Reyranella sp.]
MAAAQTMTGDFHTDLKALLPRLRIYALSLARDRDRADDLVQETIVKALAGRNSFRTGTNFGAWLFRIQRNEFISGLRRSRPTVCLDDVVSNTLSHPPRQESGLIMREFLGAFRQLAHGQREALLLAVLEGYPYARIAEHCGVSIGTIKSRISRARSLLETFLTGEEGVVGEPIAAPTRPALSTSMTLAS